MKSKDMREKLERLTVLEKKIATEVKATYEEWNNLTAELIPEFINKKPELSGLLTSPITIKYKDGRAWTLRPHYVKDGVLTNVMFKNYGFNPFSINEERSKG